MLPAVVESQQLLHTHFCSNVADVVDMSKGLHQTGFVTCCRWLCMSTLYSEACEFQDAGAKPVKMLHSNVNCSADVWPVASKVPL